MPCRSTAQLFLLLLQILELCLRSRDNLDSKNTTINLPGQTWLKASLHNNYEWGWSTVARKRKGWRWDRVSLSCHYWRSGCSEERSGKERQPLLPFLAPVSPAAVIRPALAWTEQAMGYSCLGISCLVSQTVTLTCLQQVSSQEMLEIIGFSFHPQEGKDCSQGEKPHITLPSSKEIEKAKWEPVASHPGKEWLECCSFIVRDHGSTIVISGCKAEEAISTLALSEMYAYNFILLIIYTISVMHTKYLEFSAPWSCTGEV